MKPAFCKRGSVNVRFAPESDRSAALPRIDAMRQNRAPSFSGEETVRPSRWPRGRAKSASSPGDANSIFYSAALAGGDRMQFDQLKRRDFIKLPGTAR